MKKSAVLAISSVLLLSACTSPLALVPRSSNMTTSPGARSSVASASPSVSYSTAPSGTSCPVSPNWQDVAKKASASVASVIVTDGQSQLGSGSAVAIDGEHLVTNHHVASMRGARRLFVVFSDNSVRPADLVGTDQATDLAVLKVDGGGLQPIEVQDDPVAVGEPVMAIGSPLGLSGSVSTGIVSALNRPVQAGGGQQGGEPVVTNAIQTSAPINPGNSGGALVDGCGALIGINSSIATLGQGGGSIGISFAIPVREMKDVTAQLIASGRAEHGQMGVQVGDTIADVGSKSLKAAAVGVVVPGSPAAKAGVREGDAIIALDGQPIDSALALIARVRGLKPGTEVGLTLARDGKQHDLRLTLQTSPR